MKDKLYLLLLFLLVAIPGKAQDFAPRPESQELTERKNVMVDYATGLFHYTVPLYRLKSGNYELPISLDYIGKGVKVNDPEGWFGHNWTLNLGGIVTRTMRGGFADEEIPLGYLRTENNTTPLEKDAKSVGLRQRDGESDIFTAVFNGKKVDFIIRMNKDKHIYALPLEQTDVRIECEESPGEITGWIITDNNGDRYIYQQIEKHSDVKYVSVSTSTAISNSGYTSAWHLTRILPYNGVPIDFHYNSDVRDLPDDHLPPEYLNITEVYDPYKMTYHYNPRVKEQPFDFKQYQSQFNFAIRSAQDYLKIASLQIDIDEMNSKINHFVEHGEIHLQPLMSEVLKTNNRIVGVLSNLLEMKEASEQLEESLRGLARYCKNIGNSNASMAGMYLEEAANYIEASLREVRNVTTKEISGGSSYTVFSPLPNMIIFPEYIVKFNYHSSPYLPTISLHNRDMEKISSVSFIDNNLGEVAFLDKNDKKTSSIKFNYYNKSDFSVWEEEGKDLWGYPYGRDIKEDCGGCEVYAVLHSLKAITLPDGGKIEIEYENNYARSMIVGGIRLKSLIFSDELSERNDTISYNYPQMGISVYQTFSNTVRVSYQDCEDKIDYDMVQPEGHPVVNVGNNGIYYPYVTETITGKGTTAYAFQVASPSSLINYPYFLNGLLMRKWVYDTNGKLLKKIHYKYDTYANDKDKLPQMQPSNFYLDEKSLESYYRSQGTRYLTGEEIYQWNIKPRLTPTNTDKFYKLQYGWKNYLKEEVEYKNDENTPYCQTKYCYDNPMSIHPTRIIRIGSDGSERTEVLKRVIDMADSADSVFIKMKEINLLSPIVKSLSLIDGKLLVETVYRYKADKESKAGFIAPVEELTYVPDTPEAYVQTTVDSLLFNHKESNYITEVSYHYVCLKTCRMWAKAYRRTGGKSRVYDPYGKLLLECDAIGSAADDKYKGKQDRLNREDILRALKNLERTQQNLQIIIETMEKEVKDQQFLSFLFSREHDLIVSFATEILKSEAQFDRLRFDYRYMVDNDYKIFNAFKQEYERILERYPKFTEMRKFIYSVETLIHFSEEELFDRYFPQYEIEEPIDESNIFAVSTLVPETQNLQIYVLDPSKKVSGDIIHADGSIRYTMESTSPSKLQIYDIDLSEYKDVTSISAMDVAPYIALVPEGANFKATSYNADGTVYAKFDQSGNAEFYIYDATGRVVQVEDQYGNIIKTYEYNKFKDQ